ncbi:nuclear factor 7, brain-like [Micropterus dolomieu]|uniref:nuclear factor 7, brain-like n=1 Tax=Micropterus dolomieu TaxID=147949 RepID=UPI001E8ECAC2|nr:nuclear factor 7, brain-like [Micropterus dolomieu]
MVGCGFSTKVKLTVQHNTTSQPGRAERKTECITHVLSSQPQCPQCRTAVPADAKCLPTSHILKSLAEKAKQAEKIKKEHGNEKAEVAELCPEHEEKLKLFCITDQQLTCIICRDGEKHEGHKFKPIKEAAASLRQELEKGMEKQCEDILTTESLANTQREEITKTKEKSQQLETQIRKQFEEMHQFLRKRETEIKNELKHKEEDAVEKMSKTLNAIETALSESRELQGKVTSVLEITDSDRLLKSWTEGNSMMTPEHFFRPRANDLQVVNDSLSLGPYESHLQFVVWKEMLQVIQPRAELLSLRNDDPEINVSGSSQSGLPFGSSQSGLPFGSSQSHSFRGSNQSGLPFGSSQSGLPFGSSQSGLPFGSSQSGLPFGSSQSGLPFGSSQSGLPFGSSQSGLPFGSSQSGLPFGSSKVKATFPGRK